MSYLYLTAYNSRKLWLWDLNALTFAFEKHLDTQGHRDWEVSVCHFSIEKRQQQNRTFSIKNKENIDTFEESRLY